MAPRRSGRRSVSAYKKGDYVEYQYKGSRVTGQLVKKSPNGSDAKPVWVVTPSDRRRRNEDIPEKALGKVIKAEEILNTRVQKLRKSSRVGRDSSSPTNTSHSDGSLEDEQAGKRSGSDSPTGNSARAGKSAATKKRKDDFKTQSAEKSNKKRKTVTFTQEANSTAILKKKASRRAKRASVASTRIGTRSTRGSVEAVLLPEHPARKKSSKAKKVKKDENVKVVKMLTGTLYLYRGDRPRAEFVRFK